MRLAIVLSARRLGTTSPNRRVGCVIVDIAGEVAETGYHRRKGEAHAESNALAVLSMDAHESGGGAVFRGPIFDGPGCFYPCRETSVRLRQ
jgi:diaminohydroxyphosphoribosylaminopyrimidine deaminase / 5-amino-6-(5-phosphoribosylamino)uracil reductase